MSSKAWLILLIFSGVMVALGGIIGAVSNAFYPMSKADESKQRLARSAWQVLKPELEENLKVIARTRISLSQNRVPYLLFDTAAWNTISQGGMLSGLDGSEINTALRAYSVIHKANAFHARLIELTIGSAAALSQSHTERSNLRANLAQLLRELEPHLQELGDALP